MEKAIRPLPKEDIDKLHLLIQALIRIENKESSQDTTKILNEVEGYLDQWLKSPNTDASLSSQFYNLFLLKKAYDIFQDIYTLRSEQRQKELLALGYYLQGELLAKEIKYIKLVLRNYLEIIEKFRSPLPPQ